MENSCRMLKRRDKKGFQWPLQSQTQPPKKSKKKDKKGKASVADGEVTKDELWDQMIALREELEQTKKQKRHFQNERDNCMLSWDMAKRRLEQQHALHRERLREKEAREKVLQDKIKQVHAKLQQVQLEHYNAISELEIKAAASQGLTLSEFTERELALHRRKMAQHAALLEKKSNMDKSISALMLKQEEEIMEMKYEYNDLLSQTQKHFMETFQEVFTEHSQLLGKMITQDEQEFTAKVAVQKQAVRRQWRTLIKQAKALYRDETERWYNLYESDESSQEQELPVIANSQKSSIDEDFEV